MKKQKTSETLFNNAQTYEISSDEGRDGRESNIEPEKGAWRG